MLIGTTFAWFTDEVTSANNIIRAGKLDIGMHRSYDNNDWVNAEGINANPARFYKSSKITIDCTGMTKIVFTCNNTEYATALKNSIASNANYTVSISGPIVTVEFSSAGDSFTIAKLTAQVRMDSITVTYTK